MDPGTLAVVSAVGTGAQFLGSMAQGNAAAQSAKYNAQVQMNNAEMAKRNATLASQEGAENAAIKQQETRAKVGAIKAAQAANGIDVNTGSAVDVRSSASELGMLDAISIRSNATRKAYGYQTDASDATAQAQLDKQQGKSAATAGYIEAGGTLLGNSVKASQNGTYDAWMSKNSLPWQEPGNVNPLGGYY